MSKENLQYRYIVWAYYSHEGWCPIAGSDDLTEAVMKGYGSSFGHETVVTKRIDWKVTAIDPVAHKMSCEIHKGKECDCGGTDD